MVSKSIKSNLFSKIEKCPEIVLPELDGKTAKMYRGGKICMTDHFKPLWPETFLNLV